MLDVGSMPPSSLPEVVLTGRCEVSLVRAVLPYREVAPGALPGGCLHDLGLGLVLEDDDPSRARVLDLGSGEARWADLRGPLALLGWMFPRLHRELSAGVEGGRAPSELALRSRPVAFRLLHEAGFSLLTRPLHLRMGFRDLCQDLDLHEEAAIRFTLPGAGPIRCHLDAEGSDLVVRTGRSEPLPELEAILGEAFPERRIQRTLQGEGRLTREYRVEIQEGRSLSELRGELRRLRRGFLHLLAGAEPERFRSLKEATEVFGERDSLALLDPGSGGGSGTWGGKVPPAVPVQRRERVH